MRAIQAVLCRYLIVFDTDEPDSSGDTVLIKAATDHLIVHSIQSG